MSNFKEVSLGFSEFVSQLIHETFDAVVSSQNYQLEKYADLQSKLDLSNEMYKEMFISNEEIDSKRLEYFGFDIESQMIVSTQFKNFIAANLVSDSKLVKGNKLTNAGLNEINLFISDLIIEEQKAILSTMLNGSNVTKLIVDSGEIIAKLELTNIYQEDKLSDAKNKIVKRGIKSNVRGKLSSAKNILLPSFGNKIKVNEIVDKETGLSTIIIDKEHLKNIEFSSSKIPEIRMTVKPTKLNSSSNLFAQIKINFKTI